MKPPSTGSVYCAIYPELAELARAHGYALAVHGSMASSTARLCGDCREFDEDMPRIGGGL